MARELRLDPPGVRGREMWRKESCFRGVLCGRMSFGAGNKRLVGWAEVLYVGGNKYCPGRYTRDRRGNQGTDDGKGG